MRVLFLIDSLGSGGAQRQIVQLAINFKKIGHDVDFLIYTEDYFFKYLLDTSKIDVHLINKKGIKRIYYIRKYIKQGAYSTVISFLNTPNILNCISIIGRRKKWKVIISERSSNNAFFTTLKGKLYSNLMRYSNAIVCNSYNASDLYKERFPQFKDKIFTIYNFVSQPLNEYFSETDKIGKVKLIVAASFQSNKNPEGLIKAIALLNDEERSNLLVEWYGESTVSNTGKTIYKNSIQLVDDYGLGSTIKFYPPTNEILKKMAEADVVGLFSRYEGLPNAICEGMTLSKAIIMTKTSDYQLLVDDSNGVLCDWNDPNSINASIRKLIRLSKEELRIMGLNSKVKASNLFNDKFIISRWEEIVL